GRPSGGLPAPARARARPADPAPAWHPGRPRRPRRRGRHGTDRRKGPAVIRLSTEARNLNWLVSNFVGGVPGREQAAVVSSDGLLIAMSEGLDRVAADRLSAVAAGLHSIAKGASSALDGGPVHEVIVEFEHALLFVMSVSEASVLAVTARRPCDVG